MKTDKGNFDIVLNEGWLTLGIIISFSSRNKIIDLIPGMLASAIIHI